MALSVGDAVLKSTDYLKAKGVETPRLDAEVLLASVLGSDRLKLYLEWDKPLLELETSAYREAIRRRGIEREPVARIMGRREFFGLELEVAPGVFSPRPETEGLVERAIEFARLHPDPSGNRATVFDVGTGSGCIIVAIVATEPSLAGIASDRSAKALELAKRNAHRHRVEQRIVFREGDLFAGYDGPVRILVSNPPYIAQGEAPTLPPEVRRHDPPEALFGGPDGLAVVRRLAEEGARLVTPGGAIFLEIGEDQARDGGAIFRSGPHWTEVEVEKDLSGRTRYLRARRASG